MITLKVLLLIIRDKTLQKIKHLGIYLIHQSRSVIEIDLIRRSYLSGSGIAHEVEDFVEYINLFLTKQIFKRYAGAC